MREINDIIIHCTATRRGRNHTVDQVRQWHLARGFDDIGYHYLIYTDGTLHLGRPVEQVGAHAYGHNQHSIGICYVGGLDRLAALPTPSTLPSSAPSSPSSRPS